MCSLVCESSFHVFILRCSLLRSSVNSIKLFYQLNTTYDEHTHTHTDKLSPPPLPPLTWIDCWETVATKSCIRFSHPCEIPPRWWVEVSQAGLKYAWNLHYFMFRSTGRTCCSLFGDEAAASAFHHLVSSSSSLCCPLKSPFKGSRANMLSFIMYRLLDLSSSIS